MFISLIGKFRSAMNYKVSSSHQVLDIEVVDVGDRLKVRVGQNSEFDVDFRHVGGSVYSMLVGHESYRVIIDKKGLEYAVHMRGYRYPFHVEDERTFMMRTLIGVDQVHKAGEAKAPIPGLVTKILAGKGDAVQEGQGVVLLEAMKMENEMKSPVSGVVRQVLVTEGQNVEKGQVLFVVE